MRTIVEVQTPLLPDAEKYIASIAGLDNFTAVVLEENGGINAIVAASMLKQRCDKRIFMKIACRDRNRIALYSELLTAATVGLFNLVLADGVHPLHTRFAAAKPVYEVDSLNLLRMIKHNSPGFGDATVPPLASFQWTIGVCIGGSTSADMARAKKFAASGADLFFACSLDAVSRLRLLTGNPIFLSVTKEQITDISEVLREAESAGADGVNLIVKTPEKVLDGSIAAK
ncbi:MAG: hypothetical protein JSV16_13715 [Candidatus Hydrogenedentota bacterium]|nr:MAG: hypothetical protein JSV16_13715 [Candidatus Hydrogenedentota bacterium]